LSSFVALINSVVGQLVDLVILPFRSLAPIWGLTIVSLLTGALLVVLYGKVSNQSRIKQLKRKISANLLECLLFRHDTNVALKAQANLFVCGFKYLGLALPPLVILALPCVLVMAALNLNYGARPLKIGEDALIELNLTSESNLREIALETEPGLEISQAVRTPESNRVAWRVRSKTPGSYNLQIVNGKDKFPLKAPLVFEQKVQKLHSIESVSWLTQLLYPSTESDNLKRMQAKELRFNYPSSHIFFLGLKTNWIIAFFILSLIGGLLVAKLFKIEV